MTTLLSCQNISVSFGGLMALDDLNLSIESGEVIGLIGPNGSGKTTFFNAITGLVRTRGGTISFLGEKIEDNTPIDIYRKGIRRTFQQSRLCDELSIFDNILVGGGIDNTSMAWRSVMDRRMLRRSISKKAEEIHSLLELIGNELAERMFEKVGNLRLVDRRRVEVCRALIGKPKLILLDEPSAGMTIDETKELLDDISHIRHSWPDNSMVLIEHEMRAIEHISDRCVVIDHGKQVASGTYSEVMSNPWVQEAYLGKR